MGLIANAANEGAHKPAPQSVRSRISVLLCPNRDLLEVAEKILATPDQIDWLQSFLFYIYFSLSLHYFFIVILFNPTSSYLWLNKNLSF